ncbi:MAG: TetR family transcriptional regulator [bacterium]
MNQPDQQSDAILNKALELAESTSWEKLRLSDIARELDIGLDTIYRCYAQKDDLVEAWYDQADRAMLEYAHQTNLSTMDMPARLEALILSWLNALSPHRQVSGDMLLYKLEPGHLHLQTLGLLRISRTVQWFREAANCSSTHLARIGEEIGLTSLFVTTFGIWLKDASENSQRTREFLRRELQRSERILSFLYPVVPGAPTGHAYP